MAILGAMMMSVKEVADKDPDASVWRLAMERAYEDGSATGGGSTGSSSYSCRRRGPLHTAAYVWLGKACTHPERPPPLLLGHCVR